MVISIGGARLTARLAPANPTKHALILGYVGVVLALIGLATTWNLGLGPRWYPVAWVVLYLRDRRLVRLLRLRYPTLFDSLRGRARRWYDLPEEIWVQQRSVRRDLRRLLVPLTPGDAELGAILQRVDVAERRGPTNRSGLAAIHTAPCTPADDVPIHSRKT